MRRTSRDDDDVVKRPARKADLRRNKTEAIFPAIDFSGSGENVQRGISRTKSGSSQRGRGRSRSNENLRGGTRNGGENVSGVGGGGKSKSQRGGNSNPAYSGFSSDVSMQSDLTSSYPTATDIMSNIPSEYLKNPDGAEPILYYLPKMVASSGMVTSSGVAGSAGAPSKTSTPSGSKNINRFPNLRVLLAAAEDDVRLHRARQQAAKNRDSKVIATYKIETDPNWLARQQRLNERDLLLGKLDAERYMILKELLEGNTAGLTAKEATAIQLARWQRALELYVYDPPIQSQQKKEGGSTFTISAMSQGEGGKADKMTASSAPFSQKSIPQNLDFLGLLEKLMETCAEVRWMRNNFVGASVMLLM
jgi:hypothetical protein